MTDDDPQTIVRIVDGDEIEIVAAIHEDHRKACGCTIFVDTGQLATCAQHNGCTWCNRGGWEGIILADSEDWARPACDDCYARFGGVEPS